MKKVLYILTLAVIIPFCNSCSDDHTYEDTADPVLSYYQIVGTWRLTEWNGEEIDSDARYFYMVLESKERTFTIYQNLDSANPYSMTGTFSLEYDEEEEINVVSGMYDHEFGFWSHEYRVIKTDDDTMVWTAIDDPEDVSVYKRSTLPE
ncbi:MAG: hypothetical protein ACI3ZP_11275 [Candidatus Cryptobacteroides sp.]